MPQDTKDRNYRIEYETFHSKPKQKKRRAQRNKSRSKLSKLGRVSKGDGKDVDHKDRNTGNVSLGNLKVLTIKVNRGKDN